MRSSNVVEQVYRLRPRTARTLGVAAVVMPRTHTTLAKLRGRYEPGRRERPGAPPMG